MVRQKGDSRGKRIERKYGRLVVIARLGIRRKEGR